MRPHPTLARLVLDLALHAGHGPYLIGVTVLLGLFGVVFLTARSVRSTHRRDVNTILIHALKNVLTILDP